MSYDRQRYFLPGEVLKSSARPSQQLDSALQVAQTLDTYVQPRFEILRDRNFGMVRIVFRQHAGLVQLKVDTQQEKQLIANVNAAQRDYAIFLLHCAQVPNHNFSESPRLELLYFNQQQLAMFDGSGFSGSQSKEVAAQHELDWSAIEEKATAALPQMMTGKEHQVKEGAWNILMRPVRASKQECLSCHTSSKLNATLGVMIYAVRSAKNKPAAKIGMR